MSEIVSYKGKPFTIGTCENLYYVSYQKFVSVLSSGFLEYLIGNLRPEEYALPDSGFRFRFPFPDEDKMPFCEVIDGFARGVPVRINRALIYPEEGQSSATIDLFISQQRLSIDPQSGEMLLATVFKEPEQGVYHWFGEKKDIKLAIAQILRYNSVYESDPEKKQFLRSVLVRILKGYRPLKLPGRHESIVNGIQRKRPSIKKQRGNGL